MIITGWIFYAAVYFAFAMVHSRGALITVFITYGLYFGLTEPAERSLVANLVPARLRGTAFGYFHALRPSPMPPCLVYCTPRPAPPVLFAPVLTTRQRRAIRSRDHMVTALIFKGREGT